MHNIATFSHLLADNSALCSGVNKCLNWMTINFSFNIQHRNLTKKFWTILHCTLVVALNQSLSDFLFYLFLGLCIIWVSIHQLYHALFRSSFFFHLAFHSVCNDFFKLLHRSLRKNWSKFRIMICDLDLEVFVLNVIPFQFLALLFHPHVVCIVEHLIEELLLGHPRLRRCTFVLLVEKVCH